MSGTAENVVQAHTINGGVHFHQSRMPKPRQLPGAISTLVNQKRVLRKLDEALPGIGGEPTIKVLLGPRGSGKSTVAVHWLHGCGNRFPDGQLYANLGAWSDHSVAPAEVLRGFLIALDVDRGQIPGDLDTRAALFRSLTNGRSFQVFLDDAVTPAQVRSLLPGRGASLVVVTGHGSFSSLSQQNAELVDIAPLENEMAIELLRGFVGDRIDAEPAARDSLIELCGGLPIALCVVGRLLAEVPDMPVAELLEELADPEVGITKVVVGDEPPLATVFDAGYRRLTEPAQRCYRMIGLHPAGPDISVGVLATALGLPERRIRPVVRELLVLRIVDQPTSGRLVVHNLVREHARNVADAIDTADDRRAVQDSILQWYEAGAIAADKALSPQRGWRERLFPELIVDSELADPRKWLESERVNLRSTVELAFDIGAHDVVVHLCVALWSLYEPGKYYDDLVATNKLGLVAAGGRDLVTALLKVQMGFAALHQGRLAVALSDCLAGADIARDAGNVELEASAIEGAGLVELAGKNLDEALRLLRRNLELAESLGDARRTALACMHLAKAESPDVALPLLERSLAGFRSLPIPEPGNAAKVLTWQGSILGDSGEPVAAAERLTEALAIMTELDRQFDRAQILDALGDVAVRAGEKADGFYLQALDIYVAGGYLTFAAATEKRLSALNA